MLQVINFSAASHPAPYHTATTNQDAYSYQETERHLMLALADGAGSRQRSGEGARLACEFALGYLGSQDSLPSLDQCIKETRDYLLYHDNCDELACTLVLVIIDKETGSVDVAIVGDSFAVISQGDEHMPCYCERESEYANETVFLTSFPDLDYNAFCERGYMQTFHVDVDAELASVFVSSDGLLGQTLTQGEVRAGFLPTLLRKHADGELDLARFFDYLDSRDCISDDTTAIMVTLEGATTCK